MRAGTITQEDFVRGYSQLWAINPETGENEKFADVSHADAIKAERGNPVGTYLGVVTNINTHKQYEIYQASCDLENCNCAITAKEVL